MGTSLIPLFLNSSLIFITANYTFMGLPKNDSYTIFNYRLPNYVVPYHYDIDLMPNLELRDERLIIHGESNIKITVYNKTKVISLHYVGFITNVKLTMSSELDDMVFTLSETYYVEGTEKVDLHFENMILPGHYNLFIKYVSHPPKTKGFFTVQYHTHRKSKSWFIYTIFQPNGARYVFPCWDEPGIKATFHISIKHEERYTAFSNTKIENKHEKQSVTWTHFKQTPKIHAYDVAIILSDSTDLIHTFAFNIKSSIWHRSNLRSLLHFSDTIESVITYLSLHWQFDENLNLNYMIIPGIQKESITNWALIIYREDAIIYDYTLDSLAHKEEVTRLVTRTLTNLWFHNIVSPSWWRDFWLNEALAAFFQNKIALELNMTTLFLVQAHHESLYLDNNFNMMPLQTTMSYKDTLLFSFSLSIKAPAIFHMLEHIVTRLVFHEGILKYLQIHMSKHATSNHLWNAMQTVLNKSNVKHANYKLKDMIHSWIKQQNYPIVIVKRNYDDKIIISQQLFNETNKSNKRWWIPITFTVRERFNFSSTIPHAWLSPENSNITLDPIRKNDWIIVNIRQTGYYRVKYEQWNWENIANYLNSKEYTNIHVLNRAKIIDDAYYFMMTKQLDYDMFSKLTSYLSQETNYIAWYPMFKIFEYLSSFLPFQESHILKVHMRTILDSLLLKIGFDEHPYENVLTKFLRQETLKWACILDNANCKRAAHIKLQQHLKNPEKHKLLPSWKEWTYCYGLLAEDLEIQIKLWMHLTNTENSHRKIFKYFTCIEKPDNIHIFLKFILKYNKMKYNERINAFYSAIIKFAQHNLDITLKYFEKNILSIHNQTKALSILINHVYSEDQLHKIVMYVEKKFHNDTIRNDIISMLNIRRDRIVQHTKKISELFNIKATVSDKMTASEISSIESSHHIIPTISDDVIPFHYDIKMKMMKSTDESELIIEGNCNVKIIIHRDTKKIIMQFLKHQVLTCIYSASLVNEANKIEYALSSHTTYNNVVLLQFENVLSAGRYILNMRFRNTLNKSDKLLYISKNGNKMYMWFYATHFKLIGTAYVFPCLDKPAFKAEFNISIYHPQMYTILSNMGIQKITHVHSDKKHIESHFSTTPPLSISSLIVVLIPKYDHYYRERNIWKIIKEENIWCRSYLVPYVKYISKLANGVKNYFEYLTTLEIPKIDHFITHDIQDDIIGTYGLIIYNEAAIIYDEELDSLGRKIQLNRLIARTIAYQWFGDIITPSQSSDWLCDGLAEFFTNQALTQFASKGRMNNFLALTIHHESLHLDTNGFMKPLFVKAKQTSEITSVMYFSVYIKAPAIIRMLQYISSDDVYDFIEIVREYFEKYQLQTVTSNDLWTIIEKVNSDKLHVYDYFNYTYNIPKLKTLMNTWIKKMHYPVLRVLRNYHDNTVMILQENLNIFDSNQWWIPVTYTTQTKLNFTYTLPKLWLKPVKHLNLQDIVRKHEWIIVNLQQVGYYRVNYDPINWRLIVNYLNSSNYWKIHVLNRAQIIDDAYHLMITKQLDYDTFLNLTTYLTRELDYIAWYPMLKIFEYLSPFLPFQESTPLKDHILYILNRTLAKVGYTESPPPYIDKFNFIAVLRQELAKWACILGDSHCKIIANTELVEYLNNPEEYTILPGWKEWMYCNGLNLASKITWLKFWNTYTEMSDNRMLHIISCSGGFTNPNLQLNIKVPANTLQQRECINLLYFVITMNEDDSLEITLANLKDHMFYCANDSRDIIKVLTVIINHLYLEHQFVKVEKFVQDNIQQKQDIADIQHVIIARQYYIRNQRITISMLIKRKN